MFAFLILFIHVVISPFKTKALLEAEIITVPTKNLVRAGTGDLIG